MFCGPASGQQGWHLASRRKIPLFATCSSSKHLTISMDLPIMPNCKVNRAGRL